jgi:hypothetical protein
MQREKLDRASAKQRNVDLKVKGSPGKGKRYRSTTQFVRADRTARGKVRITPKGRDYLHSIETTPEREKRLAKSRRRSKTTIIGGRVLRYGVPVLMVGWTVSDLIKGKSPTELAMEATFMDTLQPLPQGEKKSGSSMMTIAPIVMHMDLNPFNWKGF